MHLHADFRLFFYPQSGRRCLYLPQAISVQTASWRQLFFTSTIFVGACSALRRLTTVTTAMARLINA